VKSTDDVVLHDAPLYGVSEILLARKHPELRRFSSLTYFTKGTWLKRKANELSVRVLLPIDPLLRIAEKSAGQSAKVGTRIFSARQRLCINRSGVKAAGGWKQFERDYAMVLPVLTYKCVGPARARVYPEPAVDHGRFKKQMGWLKRNGFTPIRPGDWLAWQLEGKPLPPKPVLLTFNFAYADLVEYAFPVLRQHGFAATVFVVTGEIGGYNSWDHKNEFAMMRCMSTDQIRHWSGQGIEFGAHSRTHADLTTLTAAELEEEIAGSGRDLAGILGAIPSSFAYPFGIYNDAVLGCIAKNFQLAFTCEEGLNGLGTEACLMRRTTAQPGDSLLDFALRVKFGWNPIERLRARVRLRTRLRGMFRMLKGS
jgi:peptidoglycan/xylan/chitin deacetylase (PgdA/CDA1 family)